MLGIGPLMRLVNDPALRENAEKAMQAIINSHATIARLENKLDFVIREMGHDPAIIGAGGGGNLAALPARLSDGVGATAAAGPTFDHGAGSDATVAREAGETPAGAGAGAGAAARFFRGGG
jgi:hypothetical protein